ncbi:MAG: DoxX family protein [Flavobacterium sp.]|nr:DoxX family protein [Flavobacterium sp.]
MKESIFIWIVKIIAVTILTQTLYFKFIASPESVCIFSTLGIEPYGRIGSGIVELIASVLIVIPRTTLLGAILCLGTMVGAIMSHLTKLGIDVQNDGGTLFILAVITFSCCAILIYSNRCKILDVLKLKL